VDGLDEAPLRELLRLAGSGPEAGAPEQALGVRALERARVDGGGHPLSIETFSGSMTTRKGERL
jgi:hypothetical protein